MIPEKLQLAPPMVKSEPNTPIYSTNTQEDEAPGAWFTPATHKERIAIMTMELIPNILLAMSQDHATTTPTQYFSPRLMPLIDRMKFHFSRSMALARHEAENGVFEWPGSPSKRPSEPVLPDDVFNSLECEAFLAGIEEIHRPDKGRQVIYRRYWRLLAPPAGLEAQRGGVVSAGSLLEVHVRNGVLDCATRNWDITPKLLVGEFVIGPDGRSTTGRMITD